MAQVGHVLLVTVGSTKFEDLLDVVDSEAFVETVVGRGYRALVVQYGPHAAGPPARLPALAARFGLEYRAFDMSPAFPSFLAQAELVISHAGGLASPAVRPRPHPCSAVTAGSGTILEALSLKKRLIVVVNERLMDNHQTEIASVMEQVMFMFAPAAQARDTQQPS